MSSPPDVASYSVKTSGVTVPERVGLRLPLPNFRVIWEPVMVPVTEADVQRLRVVLLF
jgi:hypothetical protein